MPVLSPPSLMDNRPSKPPRSDNERAIVARGLAEEGPVPAGQRSGKIRDTEPDPRKILAAWSVFVAEIAPQVAPILLLARDAAASVPEAAALLEEINAVPRADDP